MILKNQSPALQTFPRRLALLLLGGVVLLCVILVIYNWQQSYRNQVVEEGHFTSAENRTGDLFIHQADTFYNADLQNSEKAFSGKYSVKVNRDTVQSDHYGLIWKKNDLPAGAYFRTSVWVQSGYILPSVFLQVKIKQGETERIYREHLAFEHQKGWHKISIYFATPPDTKIPVAVEVATGTDGTIEAWFDDLSIEKITHFSYLQQFKVPELKISYSKKAAAKMKKKKEEAFKVGILESSEDDWFKARIEGNEETPGKKVEIRLKGDWIDHLLSKDGMRIKVKGGDTWNGMRVFSIHHPKARSYLHEYVLHKFWQQADVLTTRYSFVQMASSEHPSRLFAMEEHFDKILLEHQKRREGPILKFSEAGFWEYEKRQGQLNMASRTNALISPVRTLAAAPVEAFQPEKTMDSLGLKAQFDQAHILLDNYRNETLPATDVFDLDRMARFYATLDVFGAHHSSHWNNLRFYYNPVTSKLEPIGYDGFGTSLGDIERFLGEGALNPHLRRFDRLENRIFRVPKFVRLYLSYLDQYSNLTFIKSFMGSLQPELEHLEQLIQVETPDYRFSDDWLVYNTKKIRAALIPFGESSLRIFTQSTNATEQTLAITNYHTFPLEIIGWSRTNTSDPVPFSKPFLTPGFPNRPLLNYPVASQDPIPAQTRNQLLQALPTPEQQQEITTLKVPPSAKYLCYQLMGMDQIYRSPLLPYASASTTIPVKSLARQSSLEDFPFLIITKNIITVLKGKHTVDKTIVIPAQYTLRIGAETTLDFIRKAGLISYGVVELLGSEESPVLITSSDKTGNGFTVLQTEDATSRMEYVIFDNLNTLNETGWTLTGAVNFYEAPVDIQYCVFRNNHCEDGLNIIRSNFTLSNSLITNTPFDGLDIDFSQGVITDCRFSKTGNDGMDFSGSRILLKSSKVEAAGDKGISVGEATDITIKNVIVDGAVIGLAAKDLSTVIIDQMTLDNCDQGLAAYQKKMEYGGSKIIANKIIFKKLRRNYIIQENCVLQIGEVRIF